MSLNESTTVASDEDYNLDPGLRYSCQLYNIVMYAVIGGLLCVLGCIGNILAFIVFWCDKVKTSTSLLFQCLSVIDTLLLLSAFPLYVVITLLESTKLRNEDETYKAKIYLLPVAFIGQTATIWVTVLVAFNRYIAVCQPFKAARLCTVVQAKRQLTVVLTLSVIYNIPKFAECLTPLGDSDLYYIIYSNILYLIFLLTLPLLSLTVVNVRLITALKEIKRKRQEMQQSARQAQDNNVTLVLIIVVIVFSVCQAPALLNQIFWNVFDASARECGGFQFYYSRVSNMLVVFNSAVNFPIYAVFNTRFRQVLIEQVLSPCFQRRQISTSGGLTMTTRVGGACVGVAIDVPKKSNGATVNTEVETKQPPSADERKQPYSQCCTEVDPSDDVLRQSTVLPDKNLVLSSVDDDPCEVITALV